MPSLDKVSKVVGAQRRSSSVARAKGSLRRVAEPSLKVLPISIWSPSAQNTTHSPPIQGDVGNDHFGAKGGKDSLFTNAELVVGVVLSILQNSDLKKASLCVEEAKLSLQGAASVRPSAFSYPSHRCVIVIY